MRFSLTSTVLRTAFFLPLMTILSASCAVDPNFHMPSVASPRAFRNAPSAASTNSLADLPWWSVFQDQTLQNLIQTALTNNYDLRIAISRVEQARYIQRQAQSAFLPQVGYAGEAERGKNVVLGLPTSNRTTLASYLGGFDVLWEIDFWGRIRRQNEAVEAYRAAVEVSNDRYRAGKASYYQVLEAQQQLFPAENALSKIEANRRLVVVQFYKSLGGGWNLDDLQPRIPELWTPSH